MASSALTLIGPIPRGRPTEYSEAIADEICARMAEGETLSHICMEEDMPNRATVWRWTLAYPEFEQRYARAREALVDYEADQIRDIADESGGDAYVDGEGKARIDGEAIQRAKLRVETRRWRAERLNRRVYGNSIKHEVEPAVHPAHAAERVPPGLEWLAGRLQKPEPADRPEPDTGTVGEG